jgi:hypothetical protein
MTLGVVAAATANNAQPCEEVEMMPMINQQRENGAAVLAAPLLCPPRTSPVSTGRAMCMKSKYIAIVMCVGIAFSIASFVSNVVQQIASSRTLANNVANAAIKVLTPSLPTPTPSPHIDNDNRNNNTTAATTV